MKRLSLLLDEISKKEKEIILMKREAKKLALQDLIEQAKNLKIPAGFEGFYQDTISKMEKASEVYEYVDDSSLRIFVEKQFNILNEKSNPSSQQRSPLSIRKNNKGQKLPNTVISSIYSTTTSSDPLLISNLRASGFSDTNIALSL